MSEQQFPEQGSDSNNPQDRMSALFAQLILQQTNMAMMLLGKVAHPETGQTYKDIEAARLFIDQLEMIETKTKSNLTKEESGLLKQSLMNLRLAFVDAVNSPDPQNRPEAVPAAASTARASAGSTTAPSTSTEDEHRKKFSKKY
jgi:hypothetical protein